MTKSDKNTVKKTPPPPPPPTKKAAELAPQAAIENNNSNEVIEGNIVAPLDLNFFFTKQPEKLDFIWQGGPLAGTVGALVAPGGAGKSFFALEAAIAIAAKEIESADLLGLKPTEAGVVDYYVFEDPVPVLHHRLHAISAYLSLEARQLVQKNLRLRPMIGNTGFDFALNMTLSEQIIEASKGSRLIVFDTLSRTHSYDENKNGEMAVLLKQLEYIAIKTGAAVLFLHHTNKGSASEGRGGEQQAARGASALIDNARWCGFVQTMTEKESETFFTSHETEPIGKEARRFYLRHGVSKQNYSMPLEDVWLERREGGVLKPVDLVHVSTQQQRENLKGRSRKLTKKELSNDENW